MEIFRKVGDNPDVVFIKGSDENDIVTYTGKLNFVGGYAHPSFSPNGSGSALTFEKANVVVLDCSMRNVGIDTVNALFNGFIGEQNTDRMKNITFLLAKDFDQQSIDAFNGFNNRLASQKIQTAIVPVKINSVGTARQGNVGDVAAVLNVTPQTSFESWVDSFFPTTVS